MVVGEGDKIDICIKCDSDDTDFRSTLYGYRGDSRHYKSLEGQEWDFDTSHSQYNNNSTDANWG